MIRASIVASLFICVQAFCQSPLSYAELKGTWSMKFDLHGQIKKEAEPNGALEQAVLNGVSSFVETLTDAMNIQFTFNPNEELILTTQYDRNKPEVKKGTYTITKKGQVKFSSEPNFKSNSDLWVLIGKNLYPVNEDGTTNKGVFLTRTK
jgi:hypothetical protein